MKTRLYVRNKDVSEDTPLLECFEHAYTIEFPFKLSEGDKVLVARLNAKELSEGTRQIAQKDSLRVLWVDFDLDPAGDVAQNLYIQ